MFLKFGFDSGDANLEAGTIPFFDVSGSASQHATADFCRQRSPPMRVTLSSWAAMAFSTTCAPTAVPGGHPHGMNVVAGLFLKKTHQDVTRKMMAIVNVCKCKYCM